MSTSASESIRKELLWAGIGPARGLLQRIDRGGLERAAGCTVFPKKPSQPMFSTPPPAVLSVASHPLLSKQLCRREEANE